MKAGAMGKIAEEHPVLEAPTEKVSPFAFTESDEKECKEQKLRDYRQKINAKSIEKQRKGKEHLWDDATSLTLRCMKDVPAEDVMWLWHPYIALGKLTLLEGDPGIGKSWITLAIATAVSLGRGLPGQATGKPHNVMLASAEDGLGDTIRPRLNTMGADVAHVYAIDDAITLNDEGFTRLENSIGQEKPKLLIIDPLVAYLGCGVDIHRANETRSIMARLAKLAENHQLAVLAVRHLTKGGQNKAIYRGIGSIDFTAACRSVLLAGCDAEDQASRALVHIKSNLAPAGPSVGYELRDGGFYWTGESSLTAAQILAADNGAVGSELDEAATFLRDELADGPVPGKDVYRAAESIGISKRTLERAKSQISVITRRMGEKGKRGGGGWTWNLPVDLHRQDGDLNDAGSENDLHRQDRQLRKFGDVNNFEANNLSKPAAPGDVNQASILGMPVDRVIEIWRSKKSPMFALRPGEYCRDLEKLLKNPDCQELHLKAVRAWLDHL